jgi:hypothetical protein
VLTLAVATPGAEAAKTGLCQFNTVTLEFSGDAAVQANCLLRFVEFKATGSTVQTLPDAISKRVWKPVDLSLTQLRTCMTKKGLPEADFGTSTATIGASKLKYFVIHDTSSPEFSTATGFPLNINDVAWSGNKIATGWVNLKDRVNYITNRIGKSRVLTNLGAARAKPATKLEQTSQHSAARPFFIHVENIQPRLKPPGSWAHTAPDPGFSEAQMVRLAQIYVAASVVVGKWLIPAFHFNVDAELFPGVDVHDDPQKFDLPTWATKVDQFIGECKV